MWLARGRQRRPALSTRPAHIAKGAPARAPAQPALPVGSLRSCSTGVRPPVAVLEHDGRRWEQCDQQFFVKSPCHLSNNDSVNKWSAGVFDGLRIPTGWGFRCALFLDSIAKRLAISFRRFVLDCWLLASRSLRPPTRPAVAEGVGAAGEEAARAAAEEPSTKPSPARTSRRTSRFANPARSGTRSVANASFGAATSCRTPT